MQSSSWRIPDFCCCLLREDCLFNKEENSIFRSNYFCSNFRNNQCMNKFWRPCLETAAYNQSICRFCDDKIFDQLRIRRNQVKKNARSNDTNSISSGGSSSSNSNSNSSSSSSSSNSSNSSSNSSSLTLNASVAPKGDIEVVEAAEADLQLTVAYDK